MVNKILKNVLYIILLSPISVCHAYYSDDGRFSLNIPSGWVEIPKNIEKAVIGQLPPNSTSCSFQKASTNYFSHPNIIISINKMKIPTDADIYKDFQAGGINIDKIVNLKDESDYFSVLNSITKNEGAYDPTRRIWISEGVINSNDPTEGVLVNIDISQITNYGDFVVNFYSKKNETDSNLISLIQFLNSIKIDKEAEYKRTLKEEILHLLFIDRLPLNSPFRTDVVCVTTNVNSRFFNGHFNLCL